MPKKSLIKQELNSKEEEQKLTKEELRLLNQKFNEVLDDEDNPIHQTKFSYEDLIQTIEESLKKDIRNRSQKEIFNLYQFLELTNYKEEMKDDLQDEFFSSQNLFFIISQFMSIRNYNKNDVIYYEGDIGENYYIIMEGKFSLYKLKYEIKEMDIKEYYLFLYEMYLNKIERMVINKTAKINKDIFPVYKNNDILNFKEIIFKIDLVNLSKEGNEEKILSLIKENNKRPIQVNFNKVIDCDLTIEEYYNYILNSLTETEMFYFKLFNTEKKQVQIAENEFIKHLNEKEYFGNYKIDKDEFIRPESIKCSKDFSKVLVINKKSFYDSLLEDKLLMKEKQIDSIYQNSIFNVIRRNIFERAYYYKLEKETFAMNEYIFHEDDILDNIYVLKEGTVEITLLNKNIFEIKKIIQELKTMDKDILKNNQIEYDIPLNNSMISLKDIISDKKNYSLFVLNTNESFGLFEFIYNNRKAIYNLKVISDKAKIYKMNIDEFLLEKNGHIEDNEILKNTIKEKAKEQLENYLERLIVLKNSTLTKIDIEFTKNTKQAIDNYYNYFDINSVKNNMRRVNKNANINLKMNNIFIQRMEKPFHNDIKKKETLILPMIHRISSQIKYNHSLTIPSNNSIRKRNYSNLVYGNKVNNKTDNNPNNSFNQNNISKDLSEDIYMNEFKYLKKQIKEDTENFYSKPIPTDFNDINSFPKVKNPNSINNLFYSRLQQLSRSSSRKSILNNKKSKEINNYDFSNHLINSYDPSLNRNKNVNYLAIKEFYDKFNYQKVKNQLLKKKKFKLGKINN